MHQLKYNIKYKKKIKKIEKNINVNNKKYEFFFLSYPVLGLYVYNNNNN